MAKNQPLSLIVLAAGKGTRMQSPLPKVLHPVAHAPMLGHVLRAGARLMPQKVCVVVGPDMPEVEQAGRAFAKPKAIIGRQDEQLGTGHAVQCALKKMGDLSGHIVLVLYGDTPLLTTQTMKKLLDGMAEHNAVVGVLGMQQAEAGSYGRLVMGEGAALEKIVEAKDASKEELKITFANSGIMAVQGSVLKGLLEKLDNKNAKGEYYLTDIVAHARAEGRPCIALEGDASELSGVNNRLELSQAEATFQTRMRNEAINHGVHLLAPETVYFAYDTALAPNSTVHPFVVFGPGVQVNEAVEVKSFSHLEGTRVDERSSIGPFARLRPGAEIGRGVRIGNFVEIKKATLDAGAKVNHLSYIGDAFIGANANIGAGTITCNYDGFNKHFTHVGAGTFVGSNSALVAPVEIGDGSIIAAGSTITEDVEPESLAISRAPQKGKTGWAKQFRNQRNN